MNVQCHTVTTVFLSMSGRDRVIISQNRTVVATAPCMCCSGGNTIKQCCAIPNMYASLTHAVRTFFSDGECNFTWRQCSSSCHRCWWGSRHNNEVVFCETGCTHQEACFSLIQTLQ